MKNLIVGGFLTLLLPLSLFAADVQTTPESAATLVGNSSALIKERHTLYCKDLPRKYDIEMDSLYAKLQKDTTPFAQSRFSKGVSELQSQYGNFREECEKVEAAILQPALMLNSNNLNCGSDYVKRGGICITHTRNCEAQFGAHITGKSVPGDTNISACTCDVGYSFSNNMCVLKQATGTVKGASISTNTDQQKLIATLTAQLNALIEQLNLLLKKQ